jgi:hypothetical protein
LILVGFFTLSMKTMLIFFIIKKNSEHGAAQRFFYLATCVTSMYLISFLRALAAVGALRTQQEPSVRGAAAPAGDSPCVPHGGC